MDKKRCSIEGAGGEVVIGGGEIAFVICDDPMAKAAFLDAALAGARGGAVYVDLDLMYSGHVASGILPRREGVEIIAPARGGLREALAGAISRATQKRCLVVVDSLNGIERACSGGEEMAARTALMMLASLVGGSGSSVLMSCTAAPDPRGGWRLMPVGGRMVEMSPATKLYVRPEGGRILIEEIGGRAPPDGESGQDSRWTCAPKHA